MKRTAILVFALFVTAVPAMSQTDSLRNIFDHWFRNYRVAGYHPTGACLMKSLEVDSTEKTITINANDVFGAQPLTEQVVASIRDSLTSILPDSFKTYTLSLYSDSRRINDLIPNPYRAKPDGSRLYNGKEYTGKPWVMNVSKPCTFTDGLQNRHLAVWASHGRYYNHASDKWKWQRPYLYSTSEDLLTQTFVVPFLIPMLENAGAVVYSSRERCWQRGEAIVDNDDSTALGTAYQEKPGTNSWQTAPRAGFAYSGEILCDGDNPFEAGTARMATAVASAADASYVSWIPKIEHAGDYAVYVSYPVLEDAIDDARYTVWHAGVATDIRVNQAMGGGTWVYLGTFRFEADAGERNCVTLSNVSEEQGSVGADAVRFGGGMGNIARSEDEETGEPLTSGLPRYLEGARYSAQWSGVPYSFYSPYGGEDDYRDDINARSYAVNWLAGGSVFMPNAAGQKVPFELSLAVHSDAGIRSDGVVGTMGIVTTHGMTGETSYPSGLSRAASYDFASLLIDTVTADLRRIYNIPWARREVFDRDYSESNRPACVAAIIETLSHQNFQDMVYAHDPWFKFNLARSIYKGILRFESYGHNVPYVVSPLAPDNFQIDFTGDGEVTLQWKAVADTLEPTAVPTGYIVYTRTGDGDFDNGVFVAGTSAKRKLAPGIVYSFKVTAVNSGGESFPTETLAACQTENAAGTMLIVNCFDRLSGPATIETADSTGFDIYRDIGVPYIQTPEYSGEQIGFGDDDTAQGKSGYELSGKMIAGNTFDYTYVHGAAVASRYSFVSCSRKALESGSVDITRYPMVDLVLGLQKQSLHDFRNFKTFTPELQSCISKYLAGGGALLASGAYIGSDMHAQADSLFLARQLRVTHAGVVNQPGAVGGAAEAGGTFEVEQSLGGDTYAVQRMDCLKPAAVENEDFAQTCFVYADGSSAGVMFRSERCRCVTLGFPLESIRNRETLSSVMLELADYLTEK